MSPRLARVGQRLAALALLLIPVFAGSCQSIVGIEERELGPCGHFCDVVMHNCTQDNQVYENRAKCMGVCKMLEVGDDNEPQGQNTVSCRLREAGLAATDTGEADNVTLHCRSAGPEGVNCGGACESYCTLFEKACDKAQCGSHEACLAKCPGVPNRNAFSLVTDYEGDTIQCRLVHLSNASLDPGKHCGHADLARPSAHCNNVSEDTGMGGAGSDTTNEGRPTKPQCSDYCRTNMVACGTEEYENTAQCLALCDHFPVGDYTDTDQNTLGCRIYHSYNSLCDPATHCPHTGPGGEGHCGSVETGKCEAYCFLGKSICSSWKFESDEECMADCTALPDATAQQAGAALPDIRYTVDYASKNPGTLACRLLALSRAAVDPTKCDGGEIYGDGDCASP